MFDNNLEEKAVEEMRQFIGIRLGKELYGIPIEKTREITKPLPITIIPGTDTHIMGLMNLRGEVLCIVDIKIILNMGNAIPTGNSRIVVIKTREGPVGVFCDAVVDIYNTLRKDIEKPLSMAGNKIDGYMSGQIQTHEGLMGILDIEELLFNRRTNYVG